jgi:hypothetical protein
MTPVDIAAKLGTIEKERTELKARFEAHMASIEGRMNELGREREIAIQTLNHSTGMLDGQKTLLEEMMKKSGGAAGAPAAPATAPAEPAPAASPAVPPPDPGQR